MKLNLISTINSNAGQIKTTKTPKIWTFDVFEGFKKIGFLNQ